MRAGCNDTLAAMAALIQKGFEYQITYNEFVGGKTDHARHPELKPRARIVEHTPEQVLNSLSVFDVSNDRNV